MIYSKESIESCSENESSVSSYSPLIITSFASASIGSASKELLEPSICEEMLLMRSLLLMPEIVLVLVVFFFMSGFTLAPGRDSYELNMEFC